MDGTTSTLPGHHHRHFLCKPELTDGLELPVSPHLPRSRRVCPSVLSLRTPPRPPARTESRADATLSRFDRPVADFCIYEDIPYDHAIVLCGQAVLLTCRVRACHNARSSAFTAEKAVPMDLSPTCAAGIPRQQLRIINRQIDSDSSHADRGVGVYIWETQQPRFSPASSLNLRIPVNHSLLSSTPKPRPAPCTDHTMDLREGVRVSARKWLMDRVPGAYLQGWSTTVRDLHVIGNDRGTMLTNHKYLPQAVNLTELDTCVSNRAKHRGSRVPMMPVGDHLYLKFGGEVVLIEY